MIGTTLLHYRLVRALGHGGMGEVYVAEDTKLHREIALKLLPRDMAADPERLQRFQREAQAVAALNHPNVVTIYSVEDADGVPFITMELVEGRTLTDLIPHDGLHLPQFLKLAVPLADAIAAAHQHGIIHRDLKPANIMVSTDGRLKVLDFGLAKLKLLGSGAPDTSTMTSDQLTVQHSIIGTPSYMSPEQAQSHPVDHRTDIFSTGVVLYEMATGVRPFQGDTAVSILSAIIKDTPPPSVDVNPRLPRELDRIIMRCLAKDPAHRYQSALDLRSDLAIAQQQAVSEAGLLQIAARLLTLSTRRKGGWIAGLLLVALVAAGSYVLLRRDWGGASAGPASVARVLPLTTMLGIEQFPSLSPDGQWVVYSCQESDHRRIYLQRVGGQNAFPITKDPNVDDDEPGVFARRRKDRFSIEPGWRGHFYNGTHGRSGQASDSHRLQSELVPEWRKDRIRDRERPAGADELGGRERAVDRGLGHGGIAAPGGSECGAAELVPSQSSDRLT